MKRVKEIRVGIKTNGKPRLGKEEGVTILENMLIGDGFHWEKEISAILPGKVEPYCHHDTNSENSELCSDNHCKISLINSLPLETYLECVVGSEMNPSAPIEFLKAHAVISRSWAMGKILDIHPKSCEDKINSSNTLIGWDDTASHSGFHVCSDDHCQRYQGVQSITRVALNAIRETEGEVLVSPSGKLVDARFSKCCGGTTETFSTCWQTMEMECLESIKDPWCDLSNLNSQNRQLLLSSILKDYDLTTNGYGFSWEQEILKSEIEKYLFQHFGRNVGRIEKLTPIYRGPSGRIHLLRIEGSDGYLDIGKELWIRRILSPSHLYSSAFQIEDKGDKIRLIGKGWGHGVGLCQIGAANMALNGKTYHEILEFYYPGAKIKRV